MEQEKTSDRAIGSEQGHGELAVAESTSDNVSLDKGQQVAVCQAMFEPLDKTHSIAEQIVHADEWAWSLAQGSAQAMLHAGNLLRKQRDTIEVEAPGTWGEWLEENCPDISETSVKNYMRASEYYESNGGKIEGESITDIYRECGVIKQEDKAEELKGRLFKKVVIPESILKPASSLFRKFRDAIDDQFIASLKPAAAQQLLGYVRDTRKEVDRVESAIIKKFGDKPFISI